MRRQFTVEGLGVGRVPDKLVREGIAVYSVRAETKNLLTFEVENKDSEKVFAILRGSCYNVKKTAPKGLLKALGGLRRSAGLLVGMALFCAAVIFLQSRVLHVEVLGSGAYYRAEALECLLREGVGFLSPAPKNTASISAKLLSLPKVSYCALYHRGGVLTVEIEVSDEKHTIPIEPLRAPRTGRVEEIVVIRGTAAVQVGDEVEEGQVLVESSALFQEELRPVTVIARVVLSFAVGAEYADKTREQAERHAIFEYGELSEIHTERTENGWLVTGRGKTSASLNLD